jgi:hypothetical protein
MGYRRLCQIEYMLNLGALTTSPFIGNIMENLEPVGITQCLRYLFYLFDAYHLNKSIDKCKCIDFIISYKIYLFFGCSEF